MKIKYEKKNNLCKKFAKRRETAKIFSFQSNFSKTEIIVDVERVINHFWRKKPIPFFAHSAIKKCAKVFTNCVRHADPPPPVV